MGHLHNLRHTLNRALAPSGFALKRVPKSSWFPSATLPTRVGEFIIDIPTDNPLSRVYLRNTDYTGFLTRLSSLVSGKYSNAMILDIGANIGDTAGLIRTGSNLPIVCVEGDPRCYKHLQNNILQFGNVTAHQLFLGEREGEVDVMIDNDGWNSTLRFQSGPNAKRVAIHRLDSFCASLGTKKQVKLVKVDTEGMDCSILRSGIELIRHDLPVITFEYNRFNMEAHAENGIEIFDLFREIGYAKVAAHDCEGRYFSSFAIEDTDTLRNLHGYANGRSGCVFYFDFTLFHRNDEDLAKAFHSDEKTRRES